MKVMQTRALIGDFFPERNESTLDAYTADLDFFTAYLKEDNATKALEILFSLPESQANLLVLHYKSELLNLGQKPPSINRKLSTLRSLAKTARQKGFINWTIDISNEKEDLPAVLDIMEKDDINKLLKVAQSQPNKLKATRDYAMIRLMYDLALKRNLLADLQLSNVAVNNLGVTMTIPGHGYLKEKVLPAITGKALRLWLDHRGLGNGPLFNNIDYARKKTTGITSTSIYRVIRLLGEKEGLKVTPEAIRKSAIMEAIKQARKLGISEQEILVFSDHKNKISLKKFTQRKASIQKSLSNLVAKN